jgi:hypothetical protein
MSCSVLNRSNKLLRTQAGCWDYASTYEPRIVNIISKIGFSSTEKIFQLEFDRSGSPPHSCCSLVNYYFYGCLVEFFPFCTHFIYLPSTRYMVTFRINSRENSGMDSFRYSFSRRKKKPYQRKWATLIQQKHIFLKF